MRNCLFMQRFVAFALAAAALVLGVAAVPTGSAAAQASDFGAQVAERDTLIAAQENLLNAYRCMFQVDLGAVGGECPGDEVSPGTAPVDPTAADVEARDTLVAAQEGLLNAYRCNHQIDIYLVPGGCPGLVQPSPISIGGYRHLCGLRLDQTVFCWGQINDHGQLNAPDGAFSAVTAGWHHSCGLRPAGTIVCWGYGDHGLMEVPEGEFLGVSAGRWHSCGLRADRSLVCWGSNNHDVWGGRVGQATAPEGAFVSVSAGEWHSCGLRTDNTVVCWGSNRSRRSTAPGGRFLSVSAGGSHSCGLRADQTVKCWGNNEDGQSTAPGGRFLWVSAGGSHSCGLRVDQTVECWGSNEDSVGNGIVQATTPEGEFLWVSAGGSHSCGMRTDQAIECWGFTRRPFTGSFDVPVFYCASESLGYSDADLEREAEEMSSLIQFFAHQSSGLLSLRVVPGAVISPEVDWDGLSLGAWRDEVGSFPCEEEMEEWGEFDHGIVLVGIDSGGGGAGYAFWSSDSTYTAAITLEARYASDCPDHEPPRRVRDLVGDGQCWMSVSNLIKEYEKAVLHEMGHAMFRVGHSLDCSIMSYICSDYSRMGCADIWLLGWPPPDECPTERSDKSGERANASSIAGSHAHYCRLRADGTVDCWGWNTFGQAKPPEGVFTALSVGWSHTCGLRDNGTVQCWGDNSHGRLDAPTGTFVTLHADANYSCATRADGTTECWGDLWWE